MKIFQSLKTKTNMSDKAKNLITIIGMSIIAAFFIIGAIAKAIDVATLNYFEEAYRQAVITKQAATVNECKVHKALASTKLEQTTDKDERTRLNEILNVQCDF